MSLEQDLIEKYAPMADGMCFHGTPVTAMTVPELHAVIVMQELAARRLREQHHDDLSRLL
jgi:hypothetical protein